MEILINHKQNVKDVKSYLKQTADLTEGFNGFSSMQFAHDQKLDDSGRYWKDLLKVRICSSYYLSCLFMYLSSCISILGMDVHTELVRNMVAQLSH